MNISNIQKQINGLHAQQPIKSALEQHFNPNANDINQLFSLQEKNDDHITEYVNLNASAPQGSVLIIALQYAPLKVCRQLMNVLTSMDNQAAVDFVVLQEHAGNALLEGFYGLISVLEHDLRMQLLEWILSLNQRQILQLIFGQRKIFGYSASLLDRFFKLLELNDHDFTIGFISVLHRLNKDQLLILFQTSLLPARYHGLIEILDKLKRNNQTIIPILNLIETLPDEYLRKLFFGKLINAYEAPYDDTIIYHLADHNGAVHVKCLRLLSRLAHKDIIEVFTARKEDDNSPIASLMMISHVLPIEKIEIAKSIIDILSSKKEFNAILVNKFLYGETLIHVLVKQKLTAAVCYYLEKIGLPTHLNAQGVMPIELANHHQEIRALFFAYPIYQAINNKLLSVKASQKLLAERDALHKMFPETLASKWSHGQSLLHLAVIHKKFDIVNYLLAAGCNPNLDDEHGLTPLNYAIQSNDATCIQLFIATPTTLFSHPGKNNLFPLVYFIETNHFDWIQHVFKVLLTNQDQYTVPALIESLKKLSRIKVSNQSLPFFLSGRSQGKSFPENLQHYCHTAQDISAYIIYQVALLINQGNRALLSAGREYILTQLSTLASEINQPNKEIVRAQIIIFLFTMHNLTRYELINGISSDATIQKQLELIVCQGLVQPLIYSSLSLADYIFIRDYLITTPESLLSVANIYLNQADLTLLSTSLLRHLTRQLSPTLVYEHATRRRKGPLMILALEKLLEEAPSEESKIHQVTNLIRDELSLYSKNHAQPWLDEFYTVLILVEHQQIKKMVYDFLRASENMPLKEKIDQFLMNYPHQHELSTNSLFRELLFEKLLDPLLINQNSYQAALFSFIKIASYSEIEKIISCLISILHKTNNFKSESATQVTLINQIACIFNIALTKNNPCKSFLLQALTWHIEHLQHIEEPIYYHFPSLLSLLHENEWDAFEQIKPHSELEAKNWISLKLLKEGIYYPSCNVAHRLNNFMMLLETISDKPRVAAIIYLINSYQSTISHSLKDKENVSFLQVFHLLTDHLHEHDRLTVISGIFPELLNLTLDLCLLGIGGDDSQINNTCMQILTMLSLLPNEVNSVCHVLDTIKSRLGQQDFHILNTESLKNIAHDILNNPAQKNRQHVCDGIWIQRLITSPDFISVATPAVLKHLTARYRLISLTLKQEEFDHLNAWLQEMLQFQTYYHSNKINLDQQIINNDHRRTHLLHKRAQLLKFRADDSIRALYNKLEDSCFELKNNNPILAEKALSVLYDYYSETLSGLRVDILGKIADFIYTKTVLNLGDIAIAKSTLFNWIEHHLPHQEFEQRELSRQRNIFVYDAYAQKIGYISETNQVMTFIDDVPCSILDNKQFKSGDYLYDSDRRIIGTITDNSEFKNENLFQKNSSASLIVKVSLDSLKQSEHTLSLLIHNLLIEHALAVLYDSSELKKDTQKYQYIQEKIEAYVACCTQTLPAASLQTMMLYHDDHSMVNLLQKIQHAGNAHVVFEAILSDKNKQEALFAYGLHSFINYLNHHSASVIFADYLIKHHHTPWFMQGLTLFGHYAKNNQASQLLVEALIVVTHQLEKNIITDELCDAIIEAFINNHEILAIIFDVFLDDHHQPNIQAGRSSLREMLTGFFSKHNIIVLMSFLNDNPDWSNNLRYRLLLMIFDHHHARIFQKNEIRIKAKIAWQKHELLQLIVFIGKHFHQKTNYDADFAIAYRLLSELIFRAANFGITNLFYYGSQSLNLRIAALSLKRNLFDTVAARFYVDEVIKNNLKKLYTKATATILNWLSKDHAKQAVITEKLKENQALLDWQKMADDTWHATNTSDLPVIAAYLLNYSGDSATLIKLINDYFDCTNMHHHEQHLLAISRIMVQFHERDVSATIFFAIQQSLQKNPGVLNKQMLKDLTHYYTQHHLKTQLDFHQAALALIKHLGQQKNYCGIKQACFILKAEKIDSSFKLKIDHIHKIASVEDSLSLHQNRWYFKILCFFKRAWHYNRNSYLQGIKLCDDREPCQLDHLLYPKNIETTVLSGNEITRQINHIQILKKMTRYKQILQNMNATNIKSTTENLKNNQLTPGLFQKNSQKYTENHLPGALINENKNRKSEHI